MTVNQSFRDILVEIERIQPLITEHAPAAEANRHLSGVVYQAMYDAGLFGMLAPKAMAVWSCARLNAFRRGKRLPASMPLPHGTW